VFLIVNIIVIELSIIFHKSSLFNNAEKHFFILLSDADGLFPRLIRSHCKAIVIKVSYGKEYNREQKKDGKVLNKFL